MKINCIVCDICGKQLSRRDYMYSFRLPKVLEGYREIGLERVDLCNVCYYSMAQEIIKRVKEKKEK